MNKKIKLGVIILIITIILLFIGAIPLYFLGSTDFIKNNSSIFFLGYLMIYYVILGIGGISFFTSFILILIGLYKNNILYSIIFILFTIIIIGISVILLKNSPFGLFLFNS